MRVMGPRRTCSVVGVDALGGGGGGQTLAVRSNDSHRRCTDTDYCRWSSSRHTAQHVCWPCSLCPHRACRRWRLDRVSSVRQHHQHSNFVHSCSGSNNCPRHCWPRRRRRRWAPVVSCHHPWWPWLMLTRQFYYSDCDDDVGGGGGDYCGRR